MQDIGEEQHNCPLESLFNTRDIFGDELSNAKSTVFTFSSMSPGAYENSKQKFDYEEESFYRGGQKNQQWNAAVFDILHDGIASEKYGEEWKNKSAHAESFPASTSKVRKYNSSDYDFTDTFSPSIRTLFGDDKRSNVSGPSAEYFRDLTSQNEHNPVSLDQKRHHSNNETSSTDSMFCPPVWSFLGMEDSQDSISFLSKETCSAAGVKDEMSHHLGSHSMKFNKSKIKHNDQNHKHSAKKYDLGEFAADQEDPAGIDNILQEQNIGAGNYKNTINQWNCKAGHFSKNYSAFQEMLEPDCVSLEKHTSAPAASVCSSYDRTFMETDSSSIEFDHKLMSEDDIFDSFPAPEPYSATKSTHGGSKLKIFMNKEPSTNFIYEREILKQFSTTDVQFPATFPWETEEHYLYSSFADFDKDAQPSGLSKHQNICEDVKFEFRTPEKPQSKGYAEKDSLSSNDRTAGAADTNKSCSENVELQDENQVVFDGPETRDPSAENDEEAPMATEEAPSQLESGIDDKPNPHFDSHAPIPSQVPTKDSAHKNSGSKNVGSKGGGEDDASYEVMLESYVFQLLCVQKVLLEHQGRIYERR